MVKLQSEWHLCYDHDMMINTSQIILIREKIYKTKLFCKDWQLVIVASKHYIQITI